MSKNGERNLGVPAFSEGECFLLKKLKRQCHRSLGIKS